MSNKKHKVSLAGLESLGIRLRNLRIKAGLSQMKLAEILGLNPQHGYKYILRLEKGLVPNPTLRTIAGFLVACSATWQDIVDVLPSLGTDTGEEGKAVAVEPAIVPPIFTTPPALEIDLHTWLSRLKEEKLQEKNFNPLTTSQFWQLVKKVQEQAWALLRLSTQTTTGRRGYFFFIRSLCALILYAGNDEKAQQASIEKLFNQAVKQGLDPTLLREIQKLCLTLLTPSGP